MPTYYAGRAKVLGQMLVHRRRNSVNASATILRRRFVAPPRNNARYSSSSRLAPQACRRFVDVISTAVH
jgi:hypothetical protein